MKKMFMAVIAMMMTISASAQFYIYYSDGTVAKVDSISMVAPVGGNTNQENGYEYVDLGLSVRWATYNVGATKPEELGDHFAWGEVEPKDSYSEENYKWIRIWWHETEDGSCIPGYHSHSDFTKYHSTIDYKTQLELSDDAARANWGGSWRMPTWEETKELLDKCVWEMTSQNGVSGFKVIGTNRNSIFLPVDFSFGSQLGYSYWTSTVDYKYNEYDSAIMLYLDDDGDAYWEIGGRESGKMVRPVCP